MSDIKWKKGAVCYANGKQWFVWEASRDTVICEKNENVVRKWILSKLKDFKANELHTGDSDE